MNYCVGLEQFLINENHVLSEQLYNRVELQA